MRRDLRCGALGLGVALLAGCASAPVGMDRPVGGDIEELARLMTGRFSSQAQAALDPDYRDIRLSMARIWSHRADGVWLYIEQAVAGKEAEPYRQRVYHLVEEEGRLASVVFSLPDPAAAAGAGKDPKRLAGLLPEKLVPKTGCTVFLHRAGPGRFEGATAGKECLSELRGAVYATSEVVIEESGMTSWDRGFDGEGRQVWGAEKGPYQFRRLAAE